MSERSPAMRTLARAIVRSYPRSWRERYGVEVRALIEDSTPTTRDLVDLARGAGSTWLTGTALGAELRGLGAVVLAVAVCLAPAFLLSRALRSAGWTSGVFESIATAPALLLLSRLAWLINSRRSWSLRGWSRPLPTPRPVLTAIETPWWRAATFIGAVLFLASDASVRPLLPVPLVGLVFAPPVLMAWAVDIWAASPWFFERRARPTLDLTTPLAPH